MKKYGLFHRGLTLLLAVMMVVQLLPLSVLAAKGDIISTENIGFDPSTQDQKGPINWPIKIYDYLNDGMLFEPANSRADSTSTVVANTVYGGGRIKPTVPLGTDFTTTAGSSAYAYTWSSGKASTASYAVSMVAAERFISPKHIHVAYPGAGSYAFHMLHSFIKATSSSAETAQTAKEKMRYMVLVYRANGRDGDERIDIRLEYQNSGQYLYYGYEDSNTTGLPIRDTDEWIGLVVDLKEALGTSRWDDLSLVSGVYMLSGMDDSGDYVDITQVAFFDDAAEAKNFASDAQDFANDPGEHLEVAQKITLAAGEMVEEFYPDAAEPGFTFGLTSAYTHWQTGAPNSKVDTSNAYYYKRLGMNFALDSGQSTTTYTRWKNGTSSTMYTSSTASTFTPTAMTVRDNDEGVRDYVTLSGTATSSKFILTIFDETNANIGVSKLRAAYLVLVYRAKGYSDSDKFGFWASNYEGSSYSGATAFSSPGYNTAGGTLQTAIQPSPREDVWVYSVVNVGSIFDKTYVKYLGMYLPTGAGKEIDLAYVGYFADADTANTFAGKAVAYMNVGKVKGEVESGGTTHTLKAGRTWNMGNNLAYGLLFASDGPGWTTLAGGNKTDPNGYYAYAIGYDMRNGYNTDTSAINSLRKDFQGDLYSSTGGSNKVYLLQAQNMPGFSTNGYYDTSGIDYDGYTLKQIITQGWMTTGMLESGLVDGKPVYRQETVEYVANLLYETLIIPPFDADGDYNFNYLQGEKSSQFAFDINGDGDLEDSVDLTGDGYPETKEASMDLAMALRLCLGVNFTFGQNKGTYKAGSAAKGVFTTTQSKAHKLTGAFIDVRENITTCMDAAYYLLNSIFEPGSYNQAQNDYEYLTLSSAVLNDGREAFVFDAGYTTGAGSITAEGYKENSQSAVVYSPNVQIVDGEPVYGSGTISLGDVQSKDLISISDNDQFNTTRFPFLPVTDTEGDYPKDTESYYFGDDGILSLTDDGETYEGRNYNYVMVSNGEFVYYEEDSLFFEFEGDDDVYLFINDQLVLDIGGAHGISKAKIQVDDYVQWARAIKEDEAAYNALSAAEQERVDALALTEGQICSFDFYYMERHGYGANCRIVTNMHVTDPSVSVEKHASQFGQNVEFGGVVDASAAIGYEFKMTNTGNTKLYNLTFTDDVIGVSLDPEQGLVVKTGMNGSHVRDKDGGMLDATDLTATVVGTDSNGVKTTVEVSFASEQELINFLKTLQAEGTESGYDDSELTHAGSGLWVDSEVTIRGIYYIMTLEQVERGGMENIVNVTATTKIDPTANGNETKRSDAKHRVYTSGAPVYYQWAGHGMFLPVQQLLDDSTHEAGIESSQLNKYMDFFLAADHNIYNIYTTLCDKHGNAMGDRNSQSSQKYSMLESYTDPDTSDWGYLVEYENAGTYSFYVLMYLNEQNGGYGSGSGIGIMEEGKYAIIRLTVYVADVEDSTFVLDYGLRTESLDTDGELFKNDELFGSSGTMTAKLMGVSLTQPSYLHVKDYSGTDYNRISFAPMSDNDMKNIPFADGHYSMNLAVGTDGKEITYNAGNGKYSLTDIGTMRINVDVPADWDDVRLYYWYDNGANNGWPGTAMTKVDQGGSKYYLDIPADVGYVIVNNGNDAQKTDDLEVTPGMESSITVSAKPEADPYYPAVVRNVVKYADAHVKVPADWDKVYLYCWRDNGQQIANWPGVEMTLGSDGLYSGLIPSESSYVIVNNGDNKKQTYDIDILAGKEVWISLDTTSNAVRDDGVELFTATCAYTQNSYPVHVRVPENWESAYLHYWLTGTSDGSTVWPGVAMTKGSDGWYTCNVPAGVSYMVVSCGYKGDWVPYQTVNITVNAGMESWISVADERSYSNDSGVGFHEAKVVYGAEGQQAGFSFTPDRIMEEESSLWLALTVHTTGVNPSTLASNSIDVNNEVQMYKKVTVLPANVVYYEDDFSGLQYTSDTGSFTHHGDGSGRLTQQVDQAQPYGQDATYQSTANAEMSGDSLTELAVASKTASNGVSFTFVGTGFELIGRTDAKDSATIIVKVEKLGGEAPEQVVYMPVITEFDNGGDGGNEAISQTPLVRVRDLEHGRYQVSIAGSPQYDFDSWDGTSLDTLKVVPTRMYVDGIRIFQPLGSTHEAYAATEKDAQFLELRDQVADGMVAVADVENGSLDLSSGTMTWTEDLLGDDFQSTSDVFVGNRVDSSEDYLIQGPNNEVYMEGAVSNSAVVFYVSETASAGAHELQLAVRGLDYERFFGVGNSPRCVQLQYGVKLSDGRYAWRVLAIVNSGTEQYYSIPYTQCPRDDQGRYQVVVRAAAAHEADLPMVSYSTVKLTGLQLQKVAGVGEETIVYYKDGVLVQWSLWGQIGGSAASGLDLRNGKLTTVFAEDSYVALKTTTGIEYMISGGDVTDQTSVSMVETNDGGMLFVPGGKEVTFTLKRGTNDSMILSYCAHSYDAGVVTQEGSCIQDEHILYTCETCGYQKTSVTVAPGHDMDEGQQTKAPTCTEEGEFTITCRTCGYTESRALSALGHTMDDGVQTTDPGCETEGVITYACTVCGHTETEAVPALGHTLQTGGTCATCGQEVCDHQWDAGSVTKAATCVAAGVKVRTCTVCSAQKQETIAALGHAMVDGFCSRCDYATVRTVYFRNSYNWSGVKIYTWTGSTTYTGSWPGSSMTLVPGTTNLYRYNVPLDAANVIFFNSDSERTGDLTIDISGTKVYSCAAGRWVTYSGPFLSREYSLVGWINGADHGCNGDYTNVGSYIFNGKDLTVTFQNDSYVFLKTTNNSDWFMTSSYVSGNSGTFQNTSTGAEEKMFVPGGKAVTFTLVENSNGTISLSYTTAGTASYAMSASSLNLSSIEKQMASTVLVGAANETVTVPVQPDPEPEVQASLTLDYPSLSFEDEVRYNVYFTGEGLEDVAEMGLVTFASRLEDGTMADAVDVFSGYVSDGSSYMVHTEGIPAAQLGDALYFKVYAKLADGSYVYSEVGGYNAKAYANTVLSGDHADEMKALVVAMLDYGAQAQLYFGHNTDKLVNASLTEEQKALVEAYDSTMMDAIVKADADKTGDFVRVNSNFRQLYPSVSFDGAFAINLYCTPTITVDDGMTLYWWDVETMEQAEELTVENAVGSVEMTTAGGIWWGQIPGIAAKELDDTYYMTCVFRSEGQTVTTGVIAYSLGKYCADKAAAEGDAQQAFAQATAVYGYYAKSYFASIV